MTIKATDHILVYNGCERCESSGYETRGGSLTPCTICNGRGSLAKKVTVAELAAAITRIQHEAETVPDE